MITYFDELYEPWMLRDCWSAIGDDDFVITFASHVPPADTKEMTRKFNEWNRRYQFCWDDDFGQIPEDWKEMVPHWADPTHILDKILELENPYIGEDFEEN